MTNQGPRTKDIVFRVTGLPPEATVDDLSTALSELLSEDSALDTKQTTLLPSCYDDGTQTALVQFKPYSPKDLDILPNGEGYEIEYNSYDISIDKDFYGLTQLYPTAGGIKADIVAVSGLNGHAYGSWRGRGGLRRMWLRHFLGQDFPDCRTMIYGYNSKLGSNAVHTTLDYTMNFLEGLRKARRLEQEKKRPIIFIGHSFGGLIIAQSIVKARESGDTSFLHSLFQSTRAIIFFGTPHRGLLVDDILAMLGEGSPREELVRSIEGKSENLKTELDKFIQCSSSFKIVSFHETGQTRKLKQGEDGRWSRSGAYFKSVERKSSILELPGVIEEALPAEGDHSDMVKFNHRVRSMSYTSVVRHLKIFTSDAILNEIYEEHKDNTNAPQDNTFANGDKLAALILQSKSEEDLRIEERSVELHTAVCRGDESSAKMLLSGGVDINKPWGGKTLLQVAAEAGNYRMVDLLVRRGADVAAVDDKGDTALHFSAQKGHKKITEVLLAHGAKINAKNTYGSTALHFTVLRRYSKVTEVLLKHKASTSESGSDWYTPLHLAAIVGDNEAVEMLLKSGADIEAVDNKGDTALHHAAQNGQRKVTEVLLRHGAKIDAKNTYGSTALYSTPLRRCPRVTEILLENGASTTESGCDWYTPLHLAAMAGDEETVEMLLKGGTNAQITDNHGKTALDLARTAGHTKVVEVLTHRTRRR